MVVCSHVCSHGLENVECCWICCHTYHTLIEGHHYAPLYTVSMCMHHWKLWDIDRRDTKSPNVFFLPFQRFSMCKRFSTHCISGDFDGFFVAGQACFQLVCFSKFRALKSCRGVLLYFILLDILVNVFFNRETSTAGSECHTGMGDKEWLQVCSPQVQSHAFHCTTVSGWETPHCEDWKHTSAGGGVHDVPWAVVGLSPLI